ncbi:hypothetical protein [Sphingobium xenophagum]|uniref:hypothetical protein n=1 Tax=Sphingobium xenophagum TaxID=121428 RepID=UPI00286AC412|nr:hypothetical protein [Sphingobium xenophagum]
MTARIARQKRKSATPFDQRCQVAMLKFLPESHQIAFLMRKAGPATDFRSPRLDRVGQRDMNAAWLAGIAPTS